MTEANNLLSQTANPNRAKLRKELGVVTRTSEEYYIPSELASNHPDFAWLGLTDAVILTALKGQFAALTADFDLFRAGVLRGLHVISYANARYPDRVSLAAELP